MLEREKAGGAGGLTSRLLEEGDNLFNEAVWGEDLVEDVDGDGILGVVDGDEQDAIGALLRLWGREARGQQSRREQAGNTSKE